MSYFQKKHSNLNKYFCAICNFHGTMLELVAHECKNTKKSKQNDKEIKHPNRVQK